MDKVYMLGGRRSYIGVENGIYRNVSASELGAFVIKSVMDSYGLSSEEIDLVTVGNAIGAGGNIGRLASLMAGVADKTPVITLDSQCGSGLAAIMHAAMQIELGMADIAIAGGFESSSTAPVRTINKRHPDYIQDEDNTFKVAKFKPGPYDEFAMLRGAERCAEAYSMDRHELDMYAIRSHRRAAKARDKGDLNGILAGSFYERQTKPRTEKDEGIRDWISEKLLTRLPVLVPGGRYITAGNVCLTNDGAAFVGLCSERYLERYRENHQITENIFRIADIVSAGSSPDMSPASIIPAIDKLLERNRLSSSDILAWEYNEAFAVIDKLMENYVNKDCSNANIFGGALAYGHPYGASGGIITLHLMKAMEKLMKKENNIGKAEASGKRYGVCAVAAAGGIGTAMLIEEVGLHKNEI